MSSDDSKFKIVAVVSIAIMLSVMAIYESRKKHLIQHHVDTERIKLEKTLSEHERAKQQIKILQRKNSELEKTVSKSSGKNPD